MAQWQLFLQIYSYFKDNVLISFAKTVKGAAGSEHVNDFYEVRIKHYWVNITLSCPQISHSFIQMGNSSRAEFNKPVVLIRKTVTKMYQASFIISCFSKRCFAWTFFGLHGLTHATARQTEILLCKHWSLWHLSIAVTFEPFSTK